MSEPAAPSRRPRVLVADDYPENRRLFYFYLRAHFDVVSADSAEEAIGLLRAEPVDALVLDLTFGPGMDGLDAIRHVRADPALADVPALALTAHASPEDRERCLEAGFDEYLSKPVLKGPLVEAIHRLLELERPPRPPAGAAWVSRPQG